MSRQAKGARLWLQPERRDAKERLTERSVWVIRDGARKISTGCGPGALERAEEKLAEYIAAKRQPERQGTTDPHKVLIADILNIYARDVAPRHNRPKESIARLEILLAWWSDPDRAQADLKRMASDDDAFSGVAADVRGATCRVFAKVAGKPSWARRLLEDLRAALNYAFAEGHLDRAIAVTLPPKPPPRDRWLTRSEAAAAIWAAWRYKEPEGNLPNGRGARYTRRHIARFILVGIYTGTRKAAILEAAFERRPGFGYVDLGEGIFYRRPAGRRETRKRQPPIRLPSRLLAHMRRWRAKGQSFVIEHNGAPVLDVKRAFKSVMDECQIEKVTPHNLRHTAATWAMQNSGDPWQMAGYLGMSVETLLRNYGHHHQDHLDGAGEVIAGTRFTPTVSRQKHKNKRAL